MPVVSTLTPGDLWLQNYLLSPEFVEVESPSQDGKLQQNIHPKGRVDKQNISLVSPQGYSPTILYSALRLSQ